MPATISTRNLCIVRGPLTVLEAVDITLAPGHRVGVIGPNGIGKSTLLQALAGLVEPDAGSVEAAPLSATIGYLRQEPERADESVSAFLARRTGVARAVAELDATTASLAAGEENAGDRYSDALDRWLALGAADFDARVGEVWSELGLAERLVGQPMVSLSGGEAARVSLASLLLSRFDVVLLDEPTNDLDLDGLARLEAWVSDLDAPVALVSHDRTFLERTITDVVEIDHYSHRATWHAGGWSAFLAERDLARQRDQDRYDEYDTKRQSLVDRGQREREWSAKGQGKLRRSGENDKHIRHHQLNQTEQLAGRAARTDRAMERLDRNEKVEEPRTPWELRLEIPTVGRSGDDVCWCRNAIVERGENERGDNERGDNGRGGNDTSSVGSGANVAVGFRLGPIDLEISWGERVAIVGANGAGKSTLLDLLLGRIAPSEGSAGVGSNVVLGEIEQARTALVGDDGLLAAFTRATGLVVADARRLLAKFGLGPEHLHRPGSTMSPGERTRASLAVLMANGANLLVLDEPTNHLDLDAIEQLERALNAFAGTVLLVTHDRSMLDAVNLTRTVELSQGKIV